MGKIIYIKNNGVYELSKRILNDTLDNVFSETQKTLCWDCKNARADLCDKIADCIKSRIDLYDFITDGYQVYKDNQLEKFVVTKCKKFIKSKK